MVLVDRYYADFATRRRPDLDRKLQISLRHKKSWHIPAKKLSLLLPERNLPQLDADERTIAPFWYVGRPAWQSCPCFFCLEVICLQHFAVRRGKERRNQSSKARVLRLKRLPQLLALSRTRPKPENPHTGTIITARPQRRLGQ